MDKKKLIICIILFVLIAVLIMFMPDIYNFLNTDTTNYKIEDIEEEIEEVEPLTLESDVVKNLKYPIMRYSLYDQTSYYQNDSFKVQDLTNQQILINALVDVNENNMSSYDGNVGSCTDIKKRVKSTFINSRIRNILGNDLEYYASNFKVSELSNYSKFVGEWKYDSSIDSYVYYGTCEKVNTNTKYYDLRVLSDIKTEDENYIINLYSYLGFAKVENSNYFIYSDSNYKNLITSGAFTNYEDLVNIFSELNKDNFIKYKYVFKKGICTYGDYCLSESMWVNE